MRPDEIAAIEQQLTQPAVREQVRRLYRQMLKPQGMLMMKLLRSDPLNLAAAQLARLKELSTAFGYEVVMKNGQLMHPDGQHVMLIVETPVELTDHAGSSAMLAFLNEQAALLDEGITAEIICGHQHTVSNQTIVKADIQRTAGIAGLFFLVIFLVFFRDLRAVLVFLIPGASVLVAIFAADLIMGPLALLVVGLSAFIAGIAVDYGIHIYVAVRRQGHVFAVVQQIAGPICLGALTTASAFLSFLFSDVPGYRQLGCISIISILLSLLYALLVLPWFIRRSEKIGLLGPVIGRCRPLLLSRRTLRWVGTMCVLLAGLGVYWSVQVPFDHNVEHLDGAHSSIRNAEEAFMQQWGPGLAGQGLLAVTTTNYALAQELNQQIYDEVSATMPDGRFVSFASVWPSPKKQAEQVREWNDFWQNGRREQLRGLLQEAGATYHFSADAFTPFLDELCIFQQPLQEPEGNGVFDAIKDRFVQSVADGWRIVSFFPDTEAYETLLSDIQQRIPESFLVSRRALYADFSKEMSNELQRMAVIAGCLIVGVTLLVMRNIRLAMLALIPAGAGVLGMLSLMHWIGHPLNAANLIASVVVLGLCIDYGIFITASCRRPELSGTGHAVSLSMLTTLAGSTVLLFARHPALHSVGISLTAGILSGYLAAMLLVPLLYQLVMKDVADG